MKRGIGQPLPARFELELQRELRPLIKRVRATVGKITTAKEADALGVALRKEWPDAKIRQVLESIGRKVFGFADKPWKRELGLDAIKRSKKKKPPAIDEDALISQWVDEAFARVTSVRDSVAIGLKRDLKKAAAKGLDASELSRKWIRKGVPVEFGTLEGRMKTIAQNQLAILASKIQSRRAQSIGATEFVWHTKKDSQVRDAHRSLEGKTFRYDDPPSEGLPGQPVNCRCWAETVIPDQVLEDLGIDIEAFFGV